MKKANQNRGTTNMSTENQKSKPKTNSKTGKISKYFQNNTMDINDVDSPYRNLVSDIKPQQNDSISDENDFKTPIITKKYAPPKILKEKKKKIKQTKLTTKFASNKIDIDVNLDHLQMAIALSKSSYAEENPETPLENTEDEKISVKFGTLKTTLEKFGFKSNKNIMGVQNKRSNELTYKKRKASKFKYITPTLVSRTTEDRESIITSKISLILSQNIANNQKKIQKEFTFMTDIKNNLSEESLLFKLNNIPIDKLKQDFFYPESLNIPKSQIKSGYLLKNWSKIPGRDFSPTRSPNISIKDTDDLRDTTSNKYSTDIKEINDDIKETSTIKDTKSLNNRSISPDLFGSDDENFDYITSNTSKLEMTENIKPPKIKDIVEISVGDTSDLDVAKILEKSQEILESISFEIKDTFEEIKDTKFDNKSTKMTFDSEIVNKDIKDSQIKVIDTYDLTLSSDDDDNFGIKGTSDEIKDTDSKIEILKDIEEKIKETDREIKDSHIYNLTPKKNSFCFDIKDTETKIKDNNYIHTISSDDEDLDSHISQKHDESLNKTKKLLEKSLNRSSISKSSASTSSNSINISKDLNYSSQSGITHYNSYSDRKISRYSFTYEDDDEQNMEKIKDICTQRSYDIVRDDSLGYNCTKSLNVTEYVTQMLNGEKKIETVSDSDDVEENSQCSSQTSFVSDEELNYSCHYATPVARRSLEQMDFVDNFCDYEPSLSPKNNISPKGTLLDNEKNRAEEIFNNTLDSTAVLNKVLDLEQEKVDSNVKTPSNYIIKKRDITPMPYYDEMDTPKIKKELDKFGLKPLKRQRGINLLKHIYDSTHPIVKHKSFEIDQELPICKKRRLSEAKTGYTAVIGECPNLCENIDDLIFERKFRAKIPSCRIPLQIVWHNFLHNHPDIFENILLYEPLQLEVIHKMLKELGYKFHIDDLLSFLDKKCITIRTAQGNQQKKK